MRGDATERTRSNAASSTAAPAPRGAECHFCVVCPDAQEVFLLGAFNDWSTTATPMQCTEEHVWQLSVRFATGMSDGPFAYFVIDKNYRTGRAPFGPTYLLPGSWATVVRGALPARPSAGH